MKRILIVVDMQNDFVTGSLGSEDARKIVPNVVEKIRSWEGPIVCTYDTHPTNYLETLEGHYLPVPHCVYGTEGWKQIPELDKFFKHGAEFYRQHIVEVKQTFMATELANDIEDYILHDEDEEVEFELIGLCTDICVVSNALALKAAFPNCIVKVDAACCAGTTSDNHTAALKVMRSCQVEIENWEG